MSADATGKTQDDNNTEKDEVVGHDSPDFQENNDAVVVDYASSDAEADIQYASDLEIADEDIDHKSMIENENQVTIKVNTANMNSNKADVRLDDVPLQDKDDIDTRGHSNMNTNMNSDEAGTSKDDHKNVDNSNASSDDVVIKIVQERNVSAMEKGL